VAKILAPTPGQLLGKFNGRKILFESLIKVVISF
jgi:hypothetical protein